MGKVGPAGKMDHASDYRSLAHARCTERVRASQVICVFFDGFGPSINEFSWEKDGPSEIRK